MAISSVTLNFAQVGFAPICVELPEGLGRSLYAPAAAARILSLSSSLSTY
jgi:hypothetical protein